MVGKESCFRKENILPTIYRPLWLQLFGIRI
jgi:hypothetical protein